MGLMKLGIVTAQRSRRFYAWMVGLGYGLGLPLMIFDAIELIRHRFSFDYRRVALAFVDLLEIGRAHV